MTEGVFVVVFSVEPYWLPYYLAFNKYLLNKSIHGVN